MSIIYRKESYIGVTASLSERFIVALSYIIIVATFGLILPTEYLSTYIFYMTAMTVSVLFAYISQLRSDNKISPIPYWLSFCVILFVLGLRDLTGIDDHTYKEIFTYVKRDGVLYTFMAFFMEPGYLILNLIVGFFTDEYYLFQFIVSFIPLFLIYKSFQKYESFISIPLAVLLLWGPIFYQMLSVSLIRMFIAMSIVLFYSFDFLFNSKPWKFCISILFAATIHYSALILLLFLPLSISTNFLINRWKGVAIILLLITPILYLGVSKIAGIIGGRYSIYGDQGELYIGLGTFYTLPYFILCLLQKRTIPNCFINTYLGSLLLLLMCTIFAIAFAISPTMKRVNFYMELSLFILLPCIYCFSKKNKTVIAIATIFYVVFVSYVLHFTLEKHAEHLFPYYNIFFTI